MLTTLGSNNDLAVTTVSAIGNECFPLVVIDNLLPDPEQWRNRAIHSQFEIQHNGDLYPGKRATTGCAYQNAISDIIARLLPNALSRHCGANVTFQNKRIHTVYSNANAKAAELKPIQHIPHFDSLDATTWAMVHYLFEEDLGGTGFFRHKRSGFESVNHERKHKYQRMLDDDLAEFGLPRTRFIVGDTDTFEMTHRAEARFNRAIFYPSNVLHSGLLNEADIASSTHSRLTGNALFTLVFDD